MHGTGFGRRKGPGLWVWVLLAAAWAMVLLPRPDRKGEESMNPPSLSAVVTASVEAAISRPLRVYDPQKDRLVEMDLEEYVLCVVAAEMPASYNEEALKAQAVAARTLAVRKMEKGCSAREGADICADHGHCQACCFPEDMQAKWGEKAEAYRSRIEAAVRDTQGEVLYYEDQVIDVLYHAQSAGATEDLSHVFRGERPYLVSVTSQETVEPVEERFDCQTVAETINAAYPGAKLSPEGLAESIVIEESYDSGRASRVRMGEEVLTGVQVRRALGLRSAQFTVWTAGDEVIFTTWGYGHGVGMSQAGAQAMASSGQDYRSILRHYYPGTELRCTD